MFNKLMVVSPFSVANITGIEFPASEVKNIEFLIVEVSTGAENLILHSTGEEIFVNEVVPCLPLITTLVMENGSVTGWGLFSFLHDNVERSISTIKSLCIIK